jgi:hypothetical protein
MAHLYEQLDNAKQLPEKSPNQFNAYLSSIERDLPLKDERSSAMTFYSKLSRELKKQFKTADIPIPETRAKCVAVAQRVWEGLYGPEKAEKNPKVQSTLQEYSSTPESRTSSRSSSPTPEESDDSLN